MAYKVTLEQSVPRWVRVFYNILQYIDHKIASKISDMTSWRFSMLDAYCRCDHCEERRAKGLQSPARKYFKMF